jgi:hypothetical protein
MDIQTGELYQLQYALLKDFPPKLIVIIDISEERNRISYYYVNTGRLYTTFLDDFKADCFLSLT